MMKMSVVLLTEFVFVSWNPDDMCGFYILSFSEIYVNALKNSLIISTMKSYGVKVQNKL